MTGTQVDRNIVYNSSKEFYELNGSTLMLLTPVAAIDVCAEAEQYGKYVGRIEAGHWVKGGFQTDMSATWDAKITLLETGDYRENNRLAVENIHEDHAEGFEAFFVTLCTIK